MGFVSVLCVSALQFRRSGALIGSGPMFRIELAVTVFKYFSTEYSGSVFEKTISGLLDVIDDQPIRYGFIVTCSDTAVFGICVKFEVDLFL